MVEYLNFTGKGPLKVITWLVDEGEFVKKDQPIANIYESESIKEILAPFDGILKNTRVLNNQAFHSGEPLGKFIDLKEAGNIKVADVLDQRKKKIERDSRLKNLKIKATPMARKVAREYNIDLSLVIGTGPRGRIQYSDIRNYIRPSKEEITQEEKVVYGLPLTSLAKRFAKQHNINPKEIPVAAGTKKIRRSDVERFLNNPNLASEIEEEMTKPVIKESNLLPKTEEALCLNEPKSQPIRLPSQEPSFIKSNKPIILTGENVLELVGDTFKKTKDKKEKLETPTIIYLPEELTVNNLIPFRIGRICININPINKEDLINIVKDNLKVDKVNYFSNLNSLKVTNSLDKEVVIINVLDSPYFNLGGLYPIENKIVLYLYYVHQSAILGCEFDPNTYSISEISKFLLLLNNRK